jgi:hypothetical protein
VRLRNVEVEGIYVNTRNAVLTVHDQALLLQPIAMLRDLSGYGVPIPLIYCYWLDILLRISAHLSSKVLTMMSQVSHADALGGKVRDPSRYHLGHDEMCGDEHAHEEVVSFGHSLRMKVRDGHDLAYGTLSLRDPSEVCCPMTDKKAEWYEKKYPGRRVLRGAGMLFINMVTYAYHRD